MYITQDHTMQLTIKIAPREWPHEVIPQRESFIPNNHMRDIR